MEGVIFLEHMMHPCQKHPSTKMAIFFFGNTISRVPGSPCPFVVQPRIPLETSQARSRNSVERVPDDLMAAMILERFARETVSIPLFAVVNPNP